MKTLISATALLAVVVFAGCESSAPPAVGVQAVETGPPPPQPAEPSSGGAPAPAVAGTEPVQPPAGAPGEPAANQPTQPPAAAEGNQAAAPPVAPGEAAPGGASEGGPENREKAQVGVGKRGRDYEPGFITTPIAAYFRTGDRIAFEVQIPNSMKIYKASHDNKGPKTHEEFWEVIIKENGVQLPELPQGDKYIYDPKTEELMVQHPKDK
jgi:hypothetical protein